MASMSSYVLKIGGSFVGRPEANAGLIKQIEELFGDPPKQGTGVPDKIAGDGWPNGFLLQGYRVCVWRRDSGLTDRNDTQFTFFTEANHFRLGTLFANRDQMLPEVKWFYHYAQYKWHQDLLKILDTINQKVIPEKQRIHPIWFCDWKWYCGDGP